MNEPASPPETPFITRRGAILYEGVKGPYCFISFNIPELLQLQVPWRLPTRWEMRDALMTVAQQGGRVARAYPFSVRDPSLPNRPFHIDFDATTSSVRLNETFFVAMDHALDVARQVGVRLIIPLVDQWTWVGGVTSFARFRGYTENLEEAFWTNELVRADFRQVICAIVTRVNTVTGVRYNKDPFIMAWETGNELNCPYSWTKEMCAAIREADGGTHLIIDGQFGINTSSLDDPNVDIVSSHYYDGSDFVDRLKTDVKLCQGKKSFVIGEFGFRSRKSMQALLEAVVALGLDGKGVAGALLWSLRFRAEEGGFYWHQECFSPVGSFWAYRWPGFSSGERYDEEGTLRLFHEYGQRAQGKDARIVLPRPPPPTILAITDYGLITFRGSTGAKSYELQKCLGDLAGPWQVVNSGFHDAVCPQRAEIIDDDVMQRWPFTAFYRLIAVNDSGRSEPSGLVALFPVPLKPGLDPVLYFKDQESRHLMRLSQLEDGAQRSWETEDLTADAPDGGKAAPCVGASLPTAFLRSSPSVLYAGADQHLYEYEADLRQLRDHTETFGVSIRGQPSVWPGSSRACFRAADSDHLYLFSRREAQNYVVEDLTVSADLPPVSGESPLFVSEVEVMWVYNSRLFRFNIADRVSVDHTETTGVRVGGDLALLDRLKVLYGGADNGHLYEECYDGGMDEWLIIDHTQKHGAAPVGSSLRVDMVVPKVVYKSADDQKPVEHYYNGEEWVMGQVG